MSPAPQPRSIATMKSRSAYLQSPRRTETAPVVAPPRQIHAGVARVLQTTAVLVSVVSLALFVAWLVQHDIAQSVIRSAYDF